MRKQRVAFIKRVAEGMFANQPAHVLLCFDQGSHHCSTEIMRQGKNNEWSWSRLELMPNPAGQLVLVGRWAEEAANLAGCHCRAVEVGRA